MNLKVGNKVIPFDSALECYKNKRECKRRFGLSSKEYDKLITAMLRVVHAPQEQRAGSQFPISAYGDGQSYATPGTFNQSILPNSYQPITSTSQVQQSIQSGPNPTQLQSANGMGWCQSLQMQQDIQQTSNQNLMERRFQNFQSYNGHQGVSAPGAGGAPSYLQRSQVAVRAQDQQADHKIFSRTFDLTQQQMPDVSVERQGIGCRRTNWYAQ